MRHHANRLAVVSLRVAACGGNGAGGDAADSVDTVDDAPDVADDDAAPPDEGIADVTDDAPAPDEAGPPDDAADDAGLPGCDLVVELSMTPRAPVPSGVTVAAGSSPLLCWVVPPGATLPGPDGWDLWVARDDAPSGAPEDAEWVITRGVPPAERSIRYGDCPPAAMACWPAKTLRAGGHSFAIWDGTRVGGLSGSVSFAVE